MFKEKIHVTVWNEFEVEKQYPEPGKVYPDGIHSVIAGFLTENKNISAGIATLHEPEHGLTEDVLKNTDVLIWWAHKSHDSVSDDVVERVYKYVLQGMGLIVLHSAHHSKIFKKLMGTSCNLRWRESGEHMRIWNVEPSHPIAHGIPTHFEIPREEMYGERFDVPAPDELVFLGWFQGGEVMRSGCCYNRGAGKIFFFQPGHESYPVYYQKEIQRIILNAVKWAVSDKYTEGMECIHASIPLEPMQKNQREEANP